MNLEGEKTAPKQRVTVNRRMFFKTDVENDVPNKDLSGLGNLLCSQLGLSARSVRYFKLLFAPLAADIEDSTYHHGETHLKHTINVVSALLELIPGMNQKEKKILLMAAILHDIGKNVKGQDGKPVRKEHFLESAGPEVIEGKRVETGMVFVYENHAEHSAERVERILYKLNSLEKTEMFKPEEILAVKKIVGTHSKPVSLVVSAEIDRKNLQIFISFMREIGDSIFLDYAVPVLALAKADFGVMRTGSYNPSSQYVKRIEEIEMSIITNNWK